MMEITIAIFHSTIFSQNIVLCHLTVEQSKLLIVSLSTDVMSRTPGIKFFITDHGKESQNVMDKKRSIFTY